MFKDNTVIILGAGSSAEFDLPTGRDIFDQITSPNTESKGYGVFGRKFSDYYKKRLGHIGELKPLIRLGERSYHQSIDQLAVRNPSLITHAKLLSAWCLLSRIYEYEKIPMSRNSDFRRIVSSYNWRNSKIKGYPNWIGAIAGKFLQAGLKEDDMKSNRLSVISFNYDTIFSDAFSYFLRQDEIFNDLSDEIIPEIIHIFGSFGDIKSEIHEHEIEQFAEKISFMDENNQNLKPQLNRAKKLLDDADKVLLLGFDCNERNVDLIGLREISADIYAINYDGNQDLNVRLTEMLDVPEEHIMSGKTGDEMGVSRALATGFLAFPDRFTNKSIYEKRGLVTLG